MKRKSLFDDVYPLIDHVLEQHAADDFLCRNAIAHYLFELEQSQVLLEKQSAETGKDRQWLCENWVDWWSANYTKQLPIMEKYIRKYERIRKTDPLGRKKYWCYKLRKGYSEQ